MKNKMIITLALIAFFALASDMLASSKNEEIMRAMRDEINRSMKELKLEKLEKPYFIEYKLKISTEYNIVSTLGAIVNKDVSGLKTARLDVQVRVGNYKFDNTGFFDITSNFFGSTTNDDNESYSNRVVSADIDYNYLRRELWLATDAAYKEAAETLSKKEATIKNFIRRDTTWSFTEVPATKYVDTFQLDEFNVEKFTDLVVEASKVFVNYPEITNSNAKIQYNPEIIYYMNSEGTEYIKHQSSVNFNAMGVGQSQNGMHVFDAYSFVANNPNDKNFPTKKTVIEETKNIANNIKTMLEAETLEETYNGPILFSNEAACVLIAQNFANNLIAQQEDRINRGVTLITSDENSYKLFQTKIGGRVLPTFISMKDLPLTKEFQGINLAGTYKFDDDGIKPEELLIIDKGYLKTLFIDRIPIKRVRQSNGRKRNSSTCYSNLKMEVDKKYQTSDKKLKEEMIKLCKARELPYGIIVKKVISNDLITGSNNIYAMTKGKMAYPRGTTLHSFSIYKLYTDGREEPVIGGALAGFVPNLFKEIIKTGDELYVLNTFSTPFSASLFSASRANPVSIIAPALLFEEGELRLIETDYQKTSILSNPLLNK